MKSFYQITFTFLAILFFSNNAFSTIIRVNNEPGANADYDDAQDAHDAAAAGDTLHIEPSDLSYGVLTVSKELTIIGNGYFLDENLGLKANTKNSEFLYVRFNAGSENSKATGLRTEFVIYTDDITIERNYVRIWGFGGLVLSGDVSNINIFQNYFQSNISSSAGTASFIYMFNNIFNSVSFQTEDTDLYLVNNVIRGNLTISNAMVRNNILDGTAAIFNSIIQNNMGDSTQFPVGDGNHQGVPWASIFNLNCDTGAQYQLRPDSPALGQGFYGGEDLGAFDVPPGMGYVPYKLSGIPSVPSIYEFEATVNGNNLDVIISTRSNN